MAKESATERVETLEQVLIDIWHEAQECDGSRGEQQTALDSIQAQIEAEMPDVSEFEPSNSDEIGEDETDGSNADEDEDS